MFKGKSQAWGRLGDRRGSSHVQLEKSSKVEITIQLNLHQQNMTKGLFRTELGDDLEVVLLEMTVEGQEERIRARHDGNQHAVEMMRVSIVCFRNDFVSFFAHSSQTIYDLVEPAEPNETKTRTIKVSAEMTPQHVAAQILEG